MFPLKMAIEIVSFPMKNGGSFHSYVNVYQRVYNALFLDDIAIIFCEIVIPVLKTGIIMTDEDSQFKAEWP